MVFSEAVHFYNHTFENADPRVADWPLMQSPFPTITLCLSYVYIVKYLGPTLMRNREPLDMRWLMLLYNFTMVIFNFLVFYHYGIHGWFGKYSYKCQPVDYSYSPQAMGMANVCWWFYISKFIEFSDTLFFVMRKKDKHISTLHVIHHGIMPLSIWFGLKFTPGGHSTFFAFLNSFVHVLMYSYYGLSALGPHMNKYLWWKKYMTTFQMIQFIMIFVHSFQLLFVDCNYPRGFMWWIGFHAVLFWFLFAEFYKNSYQKRKGLNKSPPTKENNGSMNGHQFTNGHSYKNGYSNGYDKSSLINGNGHAHTQTNQPYSNGVNCQHETSSKKIN